MHDGLRVNARTAFDGAGRSTTRAAATQLQVCFLGDAELWARLEQRTSGLRNASWIGTTRLAGAVRVSGM